MLSLKNLLKRVKTVLGLCEKYPPPLPHSTMCRKYFVHTEEKCIACSYVKHEYTTFCKCLSNDKGSAHGVLEQL